jgi:hypothetical protein
MISASQAQSATGLELKPLNGASTGFGMIDTSGATEPITLAALINGPGPVGCQRRWYIDPHAAERADERRHRSIAPKASPSCRQVL